MKKIYFLIGLWLLVGVLLAQDGPNRVIKNKTLSLTLGSANPVGDFKGNYPTTGGFALSGPMIDLEYNVRTKGKIESVCAIGWVADYQLQWFKFDMNSYANVYSNRSSTNQIIYPNSSGSWVVQSLFLGISFNHFINNQNPYGFKAYVKTSLGFSNVSRPALSFSNSTTSEVVTISKTSATVVSALTSLKLKYLFPKGWEVFAAYEGTTPLGAINFDGVKSRSSLYGDSYFSIRQDIVATNTTIGIGYRF